MLVEIPDVICGMRTRKLSDGTFWLPRVTRQVREALEPNFINFKGTHRWAPKEAMGNDVINLQKHFENRPCYIVGKGLSLDELTSEYFPDRSPVICINEAVHKVCSLGLRNQVFGIQQDNRLRDTCFNENATMMISRQARIHYPEDKIYSYIPENYNVSTGALTVIVAIEMLKKFKATELILMCFDGCVKNVFAYAACIGYPVAGDASRFQVHRRIIDNHAEDMPLRWVIPSAPEKSVSDKPPQLLDSRPMNHDRDQAGLLAASTDMQDSLSGTAHSEHASQPDHSDKEPLT